MEFRRPQSGDVIGKNSPLAATITCRDEAGVSGTSESLLEPVWFQWEDTGGALVGALCPAWVLPSLFRVPIQVEMREAAQEAQSHFQLLPSGF